MKLSILCLALLVVGSMTQDLSKVHDWIQKDISSLEKFIQETDISSDILLGVQKTESGKNYQNWIFSTNHKQHLELTDGQVKKTNAFGPDSEYFTEITSNLIFLGTQIKDKEWVKIAMKKPENNQQRMDMFSLDNYEGVSLINTNPDGEPIMNRLLIVEKRNEIISTYDEQGKSVIYLSNLSENQNLFYVLYSQNSELNDIEKLFSYIVKNVVSLEKQTLQEEKPQSFDQGEEEVEPNGLEEIPKDEPQEEEPKDEEQVPEEKKEEPQKPQEEHPQEVPEEDCPGGEEDDTVKNKVDVDGVQHLQSQKDEKHVKLQTDQAVNQPEPDPEETEEVTEEVEEEVIVKKSAPKVGENKASLPPKAVQTKQEQNQEPESEPEPPSEEYQNCAGEELDTVKNKRDLDAELAGKQEKVFQAKEVTITTKNEEGEGSGDGDSGSGDQGSGDQGSGDQGSGDQGSGDQGSGDQGSGDQGSGDQGSGDQGSGDQGSGDQGSGDQGSGDQGSGDQGSGDQGSGDQGSGDQGSGDAGTGDSGSGDQGEKQESSDSGSGDQGSGDAGSDDQKSSDQGTDDQKSGDQGTDAGSEDQGSSDDQKSGDQGSSEDQGSGDQGTDTKSDDTGSGDQGSDDQKSGDQSGSSDDQKSGDSGSGDQGSDQQGSDDQGSGDSGSGDSKSDDKDTGDQGSGDQGSGDQESGDQGSGDQGSGDSGSGDSGSGDQGSGDTKSDDKGTGDQGSGDDSKGDQKQVDGKVDSDPEPCVILYSQCHFQGDELRLCGAHPEIPNDMKNFKVKSIKVPEGVQVTFFNKPNFDDERLHTKQEMECLETPLRLNLLELMNNLRLTRAVNINSIAVTL